MLVGEASVRVALCNNNRTSPSRITHSVRLIGAGGIAFAIRSGVNFILLLARIKSVPKCVYRGEMNLLRRLINFLLFRRSYRFALIRQALLGAESWRFATMLGASGSSYDWMLALITFRNRRSICIDVQIHPQLPPHATS